MRAASGEAVVVGFASISAPAPAAVVVAGLTAFSPTRFYAPWCGHCKVLAPKLKKAAKAMVSADALIKIGGLNVEPNRGVQSLYPDIRGFPWLKFVTSPTDPRGAINYQGGLEGGLVRCNYFIMHPAACMGCM